jgi:two-component system sensor histidine kinase KdpD
MTGFLSNILEMTRLETGEIAPRIVPVALHDVVAEALTRVADIGSVTQDLPVDLPQVAADPALLEQVLVNVLDNAVKHGGGHMGGGHMGGGHMGGSQVSIAAVALTGRVILRIADSGPGIAAEHLPHIFDSFYRAKRGDRTLPGTGLGLAIARGLMEAMGGSIDAQSPKPGATNGTVIALRLPIASLGVKT